MAQEKFIWPPRAPGREPPAPFTPSPPISTAAPSSRSGVLAVAQAVEAEFLDLTSAPLHARLADAADKHLQGSAWTIDDGMAACWRCGRSIGAFESDAGGCAWCRDLRLPWTGTVRLGAYAGLWAKVVQEVKYSRFAQLGYDLGMLLGQRIARRIDDAGVDRAGVVVMPVPTHWSRRWVRGIDHPRVIASGVAAALSRGRDTAVPMLAALTRKARPSQTSLPASKRRTSLGQTMRLRPYAPWQWGPSRSGWRRLLAHPRPTIILVDDVTTTGATLREACRAIKAGLASARTPPGPYDVLIGVVSVTDERR